MTEAGCFARNATYRFQESRCPRQRNQVTRCLGLVLWGFLLSAWAFGDVIDEATRESLNRIAAGYRANRSAILDLSMNGTIDTVYANGAKEHIDFRCWQLGERRRVDHTYSETEAFDTYSRGKTIRRAFDGDAALTHVVDSGVPAAIQPPDEFVIKSGLSVLENLQVHRKWDDSVGQIEYLMGRGWKPDKESIRVTPVNIGDHALLKVRYESQRGGSSVYEWVFDPVRGFEVVSATSSAAYGASGKPWITEDLAYDIAEVAPGVWRSVGVTQHTIELDEDGATIADVLVSVVTETCAANTGQVDNSLFTLEGIGVPVGNPVGDFRVEPHIEYTFGLPDLDKRELSKMVAATGAVSEPNREDSPDGVPRPSVPGAPWASGRYYNLDKTKPGVVLWAVVFLLAFALAFGAVRGGRKSKSASRDRNKGDSCE